MSSSKVDKFWRKWKFTFQISASNFCVNFVYKRN